MKENLHRPRCLRPSIFFRHGAFDADATSKSDKGRYENYENLFERTLNALKQGDLRTAPVLAELTKAEAISLVAKAITQALRQD